MVYVEGNLESALKLLNKRDGWKLNEFRARRYFRPKGIRRHEKDLHAAARRRWTYTKKTKNDLL